MAYITLPYEDQLPGIRGLMAYRPETGKPMNALAEVLLHNPDNSLSEGEREMIGAYVSYLNDCWFCQNVHSAAADCWMESPGLMKKVKSNPEQAPISPKLKALLAIAGSVQKGGKLVTPGQIDTARNEGATDKEIHDTVLIAAAFCMFNRYVDGLGTWAPANESDYVSSGVRIRDQGYADFDPMKMVKL